MTETIFCSDENPITSECFASPITCNNCKRKNRYNSLFEKKKKDLSRCSACLTVAYCDEDCQMEHWTKIHHNHCNYLNGKKYVETHKTRSCRLCFLENSAHEPNLRDLNHPVAVCHIQQLERTMRTIIGNKLGYHTRDAKCRSKRLYTGQLPFTLGEISGTYREQAYGKALAHIIRIVYTMMCKVKLDFRSRELFRWAEVYNNFVAMRAELWVEELTIGNPTDTVIIVSTELDSERNMDLFGLLCSSPTMKEWEKAARLAFYVIETTECFIRPLEMKIDTNKNPEWIRVEHFQSQNSRKLNRLNIYFETRKEIQMLAWPIQEYLRYSGTSELKMETVNIDPLLVNILQPVTQTKEVEDAIKEINRVARTCQNCLKNSPHTHRCTRCKSAQYCTKECQEEDFKSHKKSCLAWEKSKVRKIPNKKVQLERLSNIYKLVYDD